jgi:hypothetical protein
MPERKDSFDLTIAGSLLLIMFLVIKVYGVAGFSLTTAAGLITAQPLSVLLGTVSLYAYAFMAFVAIALFWLLILGLRNLNPVCRRLAPLIFVLMILAIFLSPWRYLIDAVACTAFAVLVAVVLSFFLGWFNRTDESAAQERDGLCKLLVAQNARKRFSEIVVTIVLIELMGFILATISRPWVPAEVVTLSSPIVANPVHPDISMTSDPVVFIVDESNGRITMLMDEDRYLVSVPESAVKQRMICHLSDQFSGAAPLLETIFGQPYEPHDLACYRNTDQPIEQAKTSPPVWIRILQWNS